jgi:hypothetical protein
MDLHPIVDPGASTIEFQVLRKGRVVRVEVPRSTLSRRFGVPEDDPHGLLVAYEAHRDVIDAAVMRRADQGGTGVVRVRPADLN